MNTFYFFQAAFDVGIAFVLAAATLAVGIPIWIALAVYGIYMIVSYGRLIDKFTEIFEKFSEIDSDTALKLADEETKDATIEEVIDRD